MENVTYSLVPHAQAASKTIATRRVWGVHSLCRRPRNMHPDRDAGLYQYPGLNGLTHPLVDRMAAAAMGVDGVQS